MTRLHTPHPATVIIAQRDGKQYETTVEFNYFADGETHCLIEDTSRLKGARVIVKHYLYPNQNEQIVRLLFLLGLIADTDAKSVEVFTPYLPYARQDKAHLPGEIISSRVLCRLLSTSGVTALHTIDCHFMKGTQETVIEGLKIKNHLAQKLLMQHLENTLGVRKYHLLGPDAGSAYLTSGETMKKVRSDTYRENVDGSISRNVAVLDDAHLTINHGTTVVADDMISTGGTMIRALENLRARGVSQLYAVTTHGLFLQESFAKIKSLADEVVYADTIPSNEAVPVVNSIYLDIIAGRV